MNNYQNYNSEEIFTDEENENHKGEINLNFKKNKGRNQNLNVKRVKKNEIDLKL
jgi:hypothetical protein